MTADGGSCTTRLRDLQGFMQLAVYGLFQVQGSRRVHVGFRPEG